ncbi:MAG: hypothetical protein KG012_21765 [Deltaproteobacteria bacterium]|nr:hypothetical protein [Deltaproteobacteria bacterium]
MRQILCGGGRFTEVDRILAAKERDPKADTTAWEREIDRLVYELYGLTEEGIKLV